MTIWISTALIIFCSAALQSITGFGFAIIAVPLLSLFFDPHLVIPLVMLISFSTLVMNIRSVWKHVDKSLLKQLIKGSLLGLPFGGAVFYFLDMQSLKLVVSVAIIGVTIVLVAKERLSGIFQIVKEKAWVFGAFSGFLTLSVGMPGPPIVLFLMSRGETQERFRALSLSFLFLIYPITLTILVLGHSVPLHSVWVVLMLLPMSWLGIQVGNRIHTKLPSKYFRVLTFSLILLTGVYSVIQCLT